MFNKPRLEVKSFNFEPDAADMDMKVADEVTHAALRLAHMGFIARPARDLIAALGIEIPPRRKEDLKPAAQKALTPHEVKAAAEHAISVGDQDDDPFAPPILFRQAGGAAGVRQSLLVLEDAKELRKRGHHDAAIRKIIAKEAEASIGEYGKDTHRPRKTIRTKGCRFRPY